MRINISGINIDILNEELNRYGRMQHHVFAPSYLVMNYNTLSCMPDVRLSNPLTDNEVPKYRGVLIAICNDLEFGEIDMVYRESE